MHPLRKKVSKRRMAYLGLRIRPSVHEERSSPSSGFPSVHKASLPHLLLRFAVKREHLLFRFAVKRDTPSVSLKTVHKALASLLSIEKDRKERKCLHAH